MVSSRLQAAPTQEELGGWGDSSGHPKLQEEAGLCTSHCPGPNTLPRRVCKASGPREGCQASFLPRLSRGSIGGCSGRWAQSFADRLSGRERAA